MRAKKLYNIQRHISACYNNNSLLYLIELSQRNSDVLSVYMIATNKDSPN